jgi:ankyrin repeat protein
MLALLVGCSSKLNAELVHEAGTGNISKIKRLIIKGAEVNSYAFDGLTPLANAIEKNQLASVKVLLENGADPNFPSSDLCPLFLAFAIGRIEIADQLINRGAKLTIPFRAQQKFREIVQSHQNDERFLFLLKKSGYLPS